MPRSLGGGASYRAVLRLPHARGLFAAAMLARLCYGLLGLPLLLTFRQATGSFAVAGTAAGLFGLAVALLGPPRARLVERRPGALMLLAGIYAGLLLAIALTGALRGVSPWPVYALATAAGVFPPPVGPLMRSLWSDLAADPQQRQTALSLDTVSESTVFALGPALGGLLIGVRSAPAAVAACAALVLVGFSALTTALRRTPARPEPRPDEAGPAGRIRRGGPLRQAGTPGLLLLVLGSAGSLAMVEIAAAARWGAATTGALLTLCSVGGVLGGLVYGRRIWRAPASRRLPVLGAAGTAVLLLVALVPVVPVAAPVLLGLGACLDMLLITAYLLVDERFPEGARMAAGAWVNTAYNLGCALGAGLAGTLLDRHGSVAVLVAAAVAAGLGTVAAATGPGPANGPAVSGSAVQHGDLTETEVLERSGK